MCDHLRDFALTGRRFKEEHNLFCNSSSSFDNFAILASRSNPFKVTITENLLINRDLSPLDKGNQSLNLKNCYA